MNFTTQSDPQKDDRTRDSSVNSASPQVDIEKDPSRDQIIRIGRRRLHRTWTRFKGEGRRKIGWRESLRNIALSSWINLLLILLPIAWASHINKDFREKSGRISVFTLNFLALVPLEHLAEYGGEQLEFYVGKALGDFIFISLNNGIEAALAIILLMHCELELLQATIVGVVLLHLLLIPGTSFLTGGVNQWEQHLNKHVSELNHTLLALGVLTLTLPAAFFSAIDTGFTTPTGIETVDYVSDAVRDQFLRMSRGASVILLIVYLASRFYLANPPSDDDTLQLHPAERQREAQLRAGEPEINSWACLTLLALTVSLMVVTAEWLVDSIEGIQEEDDIQTSWFGIILLPLISFSADGAVAVGYFFHATYRALRGRGSPPGVLAKARAIDLSIQFTLFWLPLLVLVAWWTDRPLTLLFDFFHVALLLAASILVNYVTADAKTNWAEGVTMVAFYIIIALCTWYYPGQPEVGILSRCSSIVETLYGNVTAGSSAAAGEL